MVVPAVADRGEAAHGPLAGTSSWGKKSGQQLGTCPGSAAAIVEPGFRVSGPEQHGVGSRFGTVQPAVARPRGNKAAGRPLAGRSWRGSAQA